MSLPGFAVLSSRVGRNIAQRLLSAKWPTGLLRDQLKAGQSGRLRQSQPDGGKVSTVHTLNSVNIGVTMEAAGRFRRIIVRDDWLRMHSGSDGYQFQADLYSRLIPQALGTAFTWTLSSSPQMVF